jgi:histidyl-tRNA synthetase
MRYERPQRGRLREHWQFNADVFGAPENLGEVEITSLLIHMLKSFGADQSMFAILINDRRVVDGLFKSRLKLADDESYKLYKVIDRSKKIKKEELDKQIGEIIKEPTNQKVFSSYLELKTFDELKSFLADNSLEEDAKEFMQYVDLMNELGLSEYLTYDPTIVRGLDYYTGIVFEVFDKHPDNRRAICGGGAYANLLQIFKELPLGGVGFGLGDVTLTDFLRTHNLLPNFETADNDLFIAYLDEDCRNLCFKLANDLREKGLRVELQPGALKFKKLFSTAEKKGHHYVAMIGADEKAHNVVQVKKARRQRF